MHTREMELCLFQYTITIGHVIPRMLTAILYLASLLIYVDYKANGVYGLIRLKGKQPHLVTVDSPS